MKLIESLLTLSLVFPYFTRNSKIKNKFSLICSILQNNDCYIKFKNGVHFIISNTDYTVILPLLGIERYSQIFEMENNRVCISFDGKNKFFVSSHKLNPEEKRLISLLYYGVRDGAYFYDKDHHVKIKNNKIIQIVQDEQNIIITFEGVKFFLDSIDPVVIAETYVRRIHESYSTNIENKVVIDVGASIGDTPLYFASKGAKVYAFEMTKINYDRMIRNLKLNPDLSKNITPVHAAVGKDGQVEYDENILAKERFEGGASFIINKYGKNSVKRQIEGMAIGSILKKYDMPSVELLKMDCKGCEFFLKKDELKNINRIKIEYASYLKSHKSATLKNYCVIQGMNQSSSHMILVMWHRCRIVETSLQKNSLKIKPTPVTTQKKIIEMIHSLFVSKMHSSPYYDWIKK